MAYDFVNGSEIAGHRRMCSKILKDTCEELKKKGISAQAILVGSGARNMVTRNGNGPYDLDYNLAIVKAPDEYWKNPRRLKDIIRVSLDNCAGNKLGFAEDSKSCLTVRMGGYDDPSARFKIDVAIMKKNKNGNYMRLIHIKNENHGYRNAGCNEERYKWDEVPKSHYVKKKAEKLKENNKWLDVRQRYLDRKNDYLRTGDDEPSFIIYVKAVNEIYNKYYQE